MKLFNDQTYIYYLFIKTDFDLALKQSETNQHGRRSKTNKFLT
eukprot:UN27859